MLRRRLSLATFAFAVAACGGRDLGVYRHSDGPKSGSGGSGSAVTDAGKPDADTPGCPTSVGIDWQTPLSCSGLDACTISDVQLVASDGARAFGLEKPAGSSAHSFWERTLDSSGNVVDAGPVPALNSASGLYGGTVSAVTDWFHVEETREGAPIFGLTGPVTSPGTAAFAIWYARQDGSVIRSGILLPGAKRVYPDAFVPANGDAVGIGVELDAAGNPYWGVGGPTCPTDGGPPSLCAMVPQVKLAAAHGDGASYWYWTSTDQATLEQQYPDPGYPRYGDFVTAVDLAGTAVLWERKLEVHTIVRMRADRAGNVFVAGLVDGLPNVRALSTAGDARWTASRSPTDANIVSLAVAPDALGGAVVAWNLEVNPRVSVVQHFDRTGNACAEIRVPGAVTDLLVRPDRHVVVATAQVISQLSL